ncbi:glycoside hydrolase [Aspergillus sclerotioniger CBS 115572]|uniref:Glycoside hydrolase n=1 Tax=Aspergillus sclerotioniger CBS 115572 TaxID=1450535 RepID=A0A317W472_9EURO|nr:glycoside hydrolase [Aspergillus sclerotioniger CBS 115572]PWY80769.1 glycoside hydrolase [Aspergillus sclerotioniger CBS 115572]
MANPIWLTVLVLTLGLTLHVQAKDVFAHFILDNGANFTQKHWNRDFTAAKSASIDAFALNTGYGPSNTYALLNDAFTVAATLDFKLFLSLDYSGDGHWPPDQVIKILQNYTSHPAYYKIPGTNKSLISTFEGYESLNDWTNIKQKVPDLFLVPDWSAQSPESLVKDSVVDGLLSWDAWPYGSDAMNTSADERYISALKRADKPYIMPVSPWFYTDMVRYHKNWVWQGDDLWSVRWDQVLDLEPEFLEILTWNDFGESHYIGPLHENELGIFDYGQAPFNYAAGMAHDGWRDFLEFRIGEYKNGSGKGRIGSEGVVVWYRLTPGWACEAGQTTGNAVSQGQRTMPPGEVLTDTVFFEALLERDATVEVSIGGGNASVGWSGTPQGGRGVYYGHVPMDNRTGEVVVTLSRDGRFVAQMNGESITTKCPEKLTNWNAWVGSAMANGTNATTSRASVEKSGAVAVLVSGGRRGGVLNTVISNILDWTES